MAFSTHRAMRSNARRETGPSQWYIDSDIDGRKNVGMPHWLSVTSYSFENPLELHRNMPPMRTCS